LTYERSGIFISGDSLSTKTPRQRLDSRLATAIVDFDSIDLGRVLVEKAGRSLPGSPDA
jgi:hypothetical protein